MRCCVDCCSTTAASRCVPPTRPRTAYVIVTTYRNRVYGVSPHQLRASSLVFLPRRSRPRSYRRSRRICTLRHGEQKQKMLPSKILSPPLFLASRSTRMSWWFGASLRSRLPTSIQLVSRSNATPLSIPWCKPPIRRAREILLPASVPRIAVRPIKAERRASLLKSIARGRQWLDEIVSGAVQDLDQIAQRHHCSVCQVHMTISLAFIAPSLVQAAVEGRLPRGIGVASVSD